MYMNMHSSTATVSTGSASRKQKIRPKFTNQMVEKEI
jgi:hypothetical protein